MVLAGGGGGARLADGLSQVVQLENLTVIVNTGDDFELFGLKICPDLDTVCYTLAHMANRITGWGLAEESWHVLGALSALNSPTWFRVGDRDLATHLERTRRLRAGQTLSEVTRHFCQTWQVNPFVLPMSDNPVPTMVISDDGELSFQEYFVHYQCQPRVRGFRFDGVERARPAPGLLPAIIQADLLIIGPSNPWVSIDPILSVPGIRDAIKARRNQGRRTVAVSPIIGGKTIKGPAAKMYVELGFTPSPLVVAEHYADLVTDFVLDKVDKSYIGVASNLGINVMALDTIMKSEQDRCRFADEILTMIYSEGELL